MHPSLSCGFNIIYSALLSFSPALFCSLCLYPCPLGCGFNVSNSNPTICINDLVVQQNRERGSKLSPLSQAQLIGRSVTLLEQLISDFQLHGPGAVLPIYYKRWVHAWVYYSCQSNSSTLYHIFLYITLWWLFINDGWHLQGYKGALVEWGWSWGWGGGTG